MLVRRPAIVMFLLFNVLAISLTGPSQAGRTFVRTVLMIFEIRSHKMYNKICRLQRLSEP